MDFNRIQFCVTQTHDFAWKAYLGCSPGRATGGNWRKPPVQLSGVAVVTLSLTDHSTELGGVLVLSRPTKDVSHFSAKRRRHDWRAYSLGGDTCASKTKSLLIPSIVEKTHTSLQYKPHALQFSSSLRPQHRRGVCVVLQFEHSLCPGQSCHFHEERPD